MTRDRRNNSSLWPTVLLLLVVKLTATASKNRIHDDCQDMSSTSQCSCLQVSQEFEITCPGKGISPKITVRIQQNEEVKIDCRWMNHTEYSILPKLRVGNIPIVRMHQCQLPLEQPIQTIFQKLGITSVKSLFFEISELSGSVNRLHFRGLDNLIRLRLSSNATLPDDVFTDLGNLTWLSIRSNKVRFSPNILASLENLNFIELADNDLQDLPPGVFHNQKKLNDLNIWSNNVTHLSKETFEGMSSITRLDLYNNSIVSLHPDVFFHLKNLTNISLSENHFQSLPVGLFAENKNLTYFRLHNNQVALKNLPAGLLSNLHILRQVRLNCGLETIPSDVFTNSTAIRNITISENNLTELPRLIFSYQKELIDLDLAKNKLKTLPNGIFRKTTNLIVLRLSHNRLENVSRHIFYFLRNLNELYMDNNKLLNIDIKAFRNTNDLTYISMESNQINLGYSFDFMVATDFEKSLKSPFQNLSELTRLNLRNNSISYIPTLGSGELRILDLSYNNITMFFEKYLDFESSNIFVNLTHNSIRTINFDRLNFDFPKIHIAIGENPIKCDCELASFVMFLNGKVGKHLKGAVTFSPDKLQCNAPANLKGHLIIDVLTNDLDCPQDDAPAHEFCPTECSCYAKRIYKQDRVVYCSNADFTEIPSLPNTTQWSEFELHIENNKLRELPLATTVGYSDVTELYAANNCLTQISVENIPETIKLLDLSHNRLQHLNRSVLRVLVASEYFDSLKLSHNPWMCDCVSRHLVDFVHTYHEKYPDLKEMQCLNGKKFLEVSVDALCSLKQGPVFVMSLIGAAIGLCVGGLAALYYKYQLEIKVWLYAHNMCLWFVTEEELDKDRKYDAFISYSCKDEDFIVDCLLPELENGPTPFKLCLHDRDWLAGDFIPEQIIRSVNESRRTIIVLSPNFIQSIWARMEFRTAHTAALTEGRARVIILIFDDIDNIDTLDPELEAYLRMHTYIKWGDPLFWNKLRYALPHPPNKISERGIEMVVDQPQWEMEMIFNPSI